MEPKIGGKNPENRWNFLENAPIRKKIRQNLKMNLMVAFQNNNEKFI